MEFIQETRKLISSTGYLKHKETGIVYNYPIYLGKYDSVNDYEEVFETDYQQFLERKAQEEASKELEDSSDDEIVIENIE